MKIALGYQEGAFYQSRLNDPDAKEELSKLCKEFFGESLKIQIQSIKPSHDPLEAEKKSSGSSQSISQESEKRGVEIKGSSLVKEAVDIFQAQITGVRKRTAEKDK